MHKSTAVFVGVLNILCLSLISTTHVFSQTMDSQQFCPASTTSVQELSYAVKEDNNGGCFYFYSNEWKSDPIPSQYCAPKSELKFVGALTTLLSSSTTPYQTGIMQCKYKLSNDKVKNYPVTVQSTIDQTRVLPSANWHSYSNNYMACESEDVNQCAFYFYY